MDRKRLLGACLASLAVATACGGGSSEPLSSAQLAAKVNAACRAYVKASSAVPQPRDVVSNPAAAGAYLQKLKPLVISEHTAISGLKPPPSLRAPFSRFEAASSHQLRLFESALSKTRAGNARGLRDLLSAARYKRTVMVPLERTLGFTDCQR